MILRAVLCLCLLAGTADAAQSDPVAAATQQLGAATRSLQSAEHAPDRVQALAKTVLAFEAGLAAMGDGLRRAATREAQLSQALALREVEIARLLAMLQAAQRGPSVIEVMHPAGPVGAARAGMMLAEMKPALQSQAAKLRVALEELRTLQVAQKQAATVFQDSQARAEEARAMLGSAMAARSDLPTRFREDPVRTAILISSVETLEGFTSGLSQISADPISPSNGDVSGQKGRLELPVQDYAKGMTRTRDGAVLPTRARALVTSPTAATIRYRGALLEMGNVVILEPQPDLLLIFAGLSELFGNTGDVIPAGTPLGFMGGKAPEIGRFLSLSGDHTGAEHSETLYMEIRESGRPVDPETWFRTD